MPQAILPRIPDDYRNEDDKKSEVEIQRYQVDTISACSSQEGHEIEEEEYDFPNDNAIVINDRPHIPYFGSVSVVSSNDVHFGNKTVYKGPVTIKQFVYPNGERNGEAVCGLDDLVKTVEIATNGGVINGGFAKEQKDQEREFVSKEDKCAERDQEANNVSGKLRKGVKWIKSFPCRKPKETILCLVVLFLSIAIISSIIAWRNSVKVIKIGNTSVNDEEDNNSPKDYVSDSDTVFGKLRIINRFTWLAQPPSGPMNPIKPPISLVIIHHTATVNCSSQAQCVFITRHVQTFHMESNNWSDIGYNFIIGGDGSVYEGRGWLTEGAHTFGWNNISLGVAFIGTYNSYVPAPNMLSAFRKLMAKGKELTYLTEDYQVTGARQFSGTESPGKTFFDVIKTWSHWSDVKDLKVKRISK